MQFSDLGLTPEILRALEEQGYSAPTPIQAQAIPAVLSGGDLMACAQTGTGKTAGFTLPILHHLFTHQRPRRVCTLVGLLGRGGFDEGCEAFKLNDAGCCRQGRNERQRVAGR